VTSHKWNVDAFVLCWRIAESDITVMPPFMQMAYIGDNKHKAHVISPLSAVAFGTKMSEKYKSTSCSTMQMKNWWKTISIEEKLDIIRWLEKGERIVYIFHNVRLTPSCKRTIRDSTDRVKHFAMAATKVFVCAAKLQ